MKNKKIIMPIILIIMCILTVIFAFNNSFIYDTTIIKVTNEKIIETSSPTDVFGFSEKVYTQEITAVIKNGKDKGETVEFTNTYPDSQAIESRYKKGTQLFINYKSNGDINVVGIKRDTPLIISFLLFLIILFLVGKKKGALTFASLLLNITITLLVVLLYSKGINLIFLTAIATIMFLFITLFLINGRNAKSMVAIISTIIGVTASCVITFLVIFIKGSTSVFYEQMELVTRDIKQIFYIQIIIGSLGGIMDIAVSMSSSIAELLNTNPDITHKEITKSAKVIGSDIMGTMTSTILFAYIAGSFPMIILFMKNGYSPFYIYKYNLNLEIVRALTGCIGMVLTIPVSTFISVKFLRNKGGKT